MPGREWNVLLKNRPRDFFCNITIDECKQLLEYVEESKGKSCVQLKDADNVVKNYLRDTSRYIAEKMYKNQT